MDNPVLTTMYRSMPGETKKSPEPYSIYEDVYIDPLEETGDAYTENTVPDLATELINPEDDPYAIDLDPNAEMEGQDPYDLETPLIDTEAQIDLKNDPDAVWKPKTFEEFAQAELSTDKEINWAGAVENSFVRHGFEWAMSAADENYVSPLSMEGRQLAIQSIDQKLKEIGEVRVHDYEKVREAKELWDQKYGLMLKNSLDEQAMNAELPSVSEFVELISNDWQGFGKSMVQELVNKPELIFLPQFAAARGAAAAGLAAQSLNVSTKAAQVLKVSGYATGAYLGGVTLGTLDRIADQNTKTGDYELAKSFEQSQVDGILGVVTSTAVPGAKALTKAVTTAKGNRGLQQAFALIDEQAKTNNYKMEEIDLEATVRDPQTQSFIDAYGNVYTFETRETVDSIQLTNDLKDLSKNLNKHKDDPAVAGAIKMEIKALQNKLRTENVSNAEMISIGKTIESLAHQEGQLVSSEDLVAMATKGAKRSPGETTNFITVTDASGVDHTLRRLTRDVLEDGLPLHVEGLGKVATDPKGPTAAMNKYLAGISDFTISATSSISRLRNISPTAAKLLDLVDPSSGKQGRTNVWTIQEKTMFQRGKWDVKLQGIKSTLSPEQETATMLHMRGVQASEDPAVLKAAEGIRTLLKESHDYAVAAGSKTGYRDDFLPRYYNQELLKKNPEARKAMEDLVVQTKPSREADMDKYTPENIRQSILNIAYNRVKTSDEAAYIERGTPLNPIGNRSWEDVPDSVLNEYLDPNFFAGINRYLSNTAQRVEVDRVFGYGGDKINKLLDQVAKEVGDKRPEGSSLTERERQSFMDVYDLLNGAYGSKGNRDLKTAVDTAMVFQSATKLPLVTITSLTEPLTALIKLEETGALKVLAENIVPSKVKELWGGRPADVIEAEVREVGLISDASLKERAHAVMGEGMEGLPAKVNDKLMKAFLLHQFTEHTRTMAYELSRNDIIRMAKGIALQPVGKKSTTRRRRLTELGLNPDAVAKWAIDGADVTDVIYDDIKKASARMTNQIIANPNKVNKGKWTSSNHPAARMTSQFKSFSSTYYNTIATPLISEITKKWNEGNRLGAMRDASAMTVTIGAMSYWAGYKNEYISGEEVEHDPVKFSKAMAQGAASYLMPGGYIYGPILTGGSDAYSAATGPTGGDVQRVGKAISQGRPKELLGIVPVTKRVANLVEANPEVR